MPSTVDGKILLGWMTKSEALKTLLEEAVFASPLSEQAAIALWEQYKAKVAGLGARGCQNPAHTKLSLGEKMAGERHIKKHRKEGATNLRTLVKIEPDDLVVHQLQIVLDRANNYAEKLVRPVDKIKMCLGTPGSAQLPFKKTGDTIIIPVPHSEYEIGIGPKREMQVREMARHTSVTAFDGRLLLWAGYHRCYAIALVNQEYPEEIERGLLAILTTDGDRFLGPASDLPEKRDIVRGACPPLFRDFFDDDLCMTLKLRKRRCELHLKTTNFQTSRVWVDDV
jgi:hypothetical protein